ncbi:hypothetical protein E2P64_00555 [Candidatus Bathyarchaeota archaeon]|nr:hypothetical protein E2P64_00555 [Candidatus Bathyarchaeota archaeon]
MKFGIISEGPADRLIKRAKKLNPKASIVVVDETTYKDDIFAVFVFKPFRDRADYFNGLREKAKVQPFTIVDVPLSGMARQVRSSVRSRIVEILREGSAYGYEIFKKYKARYGDISIRLVYYHLSKGEKDGLFEVKDIKNTKGNFSWGASTKRKYYKLKFPV